MEPSHEPSMWMLLKRHFISWFGFQFLVGIAIYTTLFRYTSEEVNVLIFSEVPLLVIIYSTLTHEAYMQLLQHHQIKSSYHAYHIGCVARWWNQIVSTLMAVFYLMRFAQERVYWTVTFCVILYLLQRRSRWYPQLTIVYRRVGPTEIKGVRSELEAQEQIVMLLRHLILLVILVDPASTPLALGVILGSQLMESFAQTAIYQYKIKVMSSELKLTNIDEYDAPGFSAGFSILRKLLPYIISAIKTNLFSQGEYIAVLYWAPSMRIVHYYTLVKNIRSALHSLLAHPIASCMESVFSHTPHRSLFSFFYGFYGVGWLVVNIVSWVASPVLVWPILYYSAGQEAIDNPELVRMVVLLLMLFPIDIAEAVSTAYWQVHQTQPIALWLDVIMSVLYLFFSIEIMRVWQLQGLIYAHSIPILWGALMRGAL